MSAAISQLRDLSAEFPVLAREFDGTQLTYLDSAATSQTPLCVIDAMTRYYTESRASVHRGIYPLAVEATDLFEGARERIAAWLGSTPEETIFTANATAAINLVAYTWGRANVGPRRPRRAHRDGAPLEHRALADPLPGARGASSPTCRCSTTASSTSRRSTGCWSARRSCVAVAHVSNVLGTINPVARDRPPRARARARVRARRRLAGGAADPRRPARARRRLLRLDRATRPTARPASACCTGAARCWRRCRRSSAAAT